MTQVSYRAIYSNGHSKGRPGTSRRRKCIPLSKKYRMRKLLFLLVSTAIFISSCSKDSITGSGNIITEERATGNFSAVSVSGANNVYITRGNELKVEVKGYSNLISYYETKVSGETLELHYQDDVSVKNDNIEIYITMPSITGLSISGSANINAVGEFDSTSSLEVKISGSGNISIETAFTDNYSCEISGSGSINTLGVTTDIAHVNISGSGDVRLSVNKNLEVIISGSGNVYYSGNPFIDAEVSGSGKIIKL
jgi:hypothetical protein